MNAKCQTDEASPQSCPLGASPPPSQSVAAWRGWACAAGARLPAFAALPPAGRLAHKWGNLCEPSFACSPGPRGWPLQAAPRRAHRRAFPPRLLRPLHREPLHTGNCRARGRTARCCCPINGRCGRRGSRLSWAISRSTWRCIRAGASRRCCTAVTARTKSWWWTSPRAKVVSRTGVHEAFYGLEFSKDGRQLFCSGAGDEVVHSL